MERTIERLAMPTREIGISSLLASAREINSRCEDFIVEDPRRNIRFNNDLTLTFNSGGNTHKTPLSPHSFTQLCTKLDIPVRYAKKCVEKGEVELLADNINAWLERQQSEMLLRTHGNKIRGVLSNKYSILDTHEIIQAFDEIVSDELVVKSHFINEERFHARMILPQMLKIPNEDLFAGITVDSSDVGRNNLVARLFIYKQICTNGLVVSRGMCELFKQKHIGISSDDFKTGLQKGIENLPQIVAGITESIIENTKKNLTTAEIEYIVNMVREEKALSEESAKKVIELTNTKYGKTRWGVINGITEIAQNYTLERRLELEEFAGNYLVA